MSERPAPKDLAERVWAAVGWPGFPPQSWLIPPLVASGVGHLANRTDAAWQLAAWGVVPVGELLKQRANRRRPPTAWLRFGRRKPSGSSFPSTHVATYTAFYGFTTVVLLSRGGTSRLAALVPLGLIVLVGPSRVREGDHRTSDVVGGYALGATYLAVLLGLRHWLGRRRLPDAEANGYDEDGVSDTTVPGPQIGGAIEGAAQGRDLSRSTRSVRQAKSKTKS